MWIGIDFRSPAGSTGSRSALVAMLELFESNLL